MSPRVILHLGAPKTGTSSLQHACLLRREDLARDGIVFPAPPFAPTDTRGWVSYSTTDSYDALRGIEESHVSLFWPVQRKFHPSTVLPAPLTEMQAWWAAEIDRVRHSPARALIISCERIFFEAGNYDLRAVMRLFAGLEVTVVFGLRHPEDMLRGLDATNVMGVQRDTAAPAEMGVIAGYLKYGFEEIAGRMLRRIRRRDVRPFLAADLWRSDRSILGAFLDHVGLKSALEQDYHSRPSPGLMAVELLRALNRAGLEDQSFDAIRDAVMARPGFGALKDPPSLFPRALQARIAARYARDLDWLAQSHGLVPPDAPPRPLRPVLRRPSRSALLALTDMLDLPAPLAIQARTALQRAGRGQSLSGSCVDRGEMLR